MFLKNLIDKYIDIFKGEQIVVRNILVYKIKYKNMEFALFMSRVGAFACAISYEKILAMGLEKLVMFGTCGVLDRKIEDLAIIISTSAIRDEGTSYHYMKPSDEIKVNEKYKKEFEEILNKYGISSVEGKIWTTDAPYRETRNYFNFSMQRII